MAADFSPPVPLLEPSPPLRAPVPENDNTGRTFTSGEACIIFAMLFPMMSERGREIPIFLPLPPVVWGY